jgi:AsmA-like C-terminal region
MVDQKHLPRSERLRIPGRVLVSAAMIVLALSALEYLARNWPFREAAVIQSLEAASSSKVEIGSFRGTYFPHPGCTARDVVFRHDSRSDIPPLIRIPQLTVRSTFLGMLRKHVSAVRADGMQIYIPSENQQKFMSSRQMVIDDLIANRTSLKFGRAKNKPLEFSIHWGELHNVGASGGMPFHVRVSNPEPPGEIEASGSFGPWNPGNASQTPVSGHYSFQRADLSVFRGIAGVLSSSGSFDGVLEHIVVLGSTDTSEFTVTSSRHKAELNNRFNAVVNAMNGDVWLQQVDSQFRRTEILASGSIAAQPGRPGKMTTLDLYSKNGRIQDLFLLFITADRSPMSGITSWRAHVTLPPGRHPFLRKVQLAGEFGIDAGNFTRAQTQQNVNKLSAESRDQDDHDPATVLSGLKGHVELKEGTATFSDLSFSVPGAFAEMHGTYELASHKVDLHGTLKMDSSLSHTAHGPKVVILKLMDPFFKKKPKGSQVPVKITGTYDKPSFGLDLNGQKETTSAKRLQHLYQPSTKR